MPNVQKQSSMTVSPTQLLISYKSAILKKGFYKEIETWHCGLNRFVMQIAQFKAAFCKERSGHK